MMTSLPLSSPAALTGAAQLWTAAGQAVYAAWRRYPLAWLALGVLTVLMFTEPALAQQGQQGGLPKMPLPGTTQDQNDLLNILWGWGRFLLKVLLILGGAAVFLGAAAVGVRKYMDINSRDGSLGELVPVVGAGLLVMIVTGILLTAGWTIVNNTNITP